MDENALRELELSKLCEEFFAAFDEFVTQHCSTQREAIVKLGVPRATINRWYSNREGQRFISLSNARLCAQSSDDERLAALAQVIAERLDEQKILERRRKRRSKDFHSSGLTDDEAVRAIYTHAALQLLLQDFPAGITLQELANQRRESIIDVERLHRTIAKDLVFSFVTSEYFNTFAAAVAR